MNQWTRIILVTAGAMLLPSQVTHAIYFGPVVNVDIQGSNDTQPGFQPMTASPTTYSTPAGNVTVDLDGSNFYDRGAASPPNSGAFTYSALYHDFGYVNGGIVTTTITGLNPGQPYDLRLYSYDYNNGAVTNTVTFTPISGTTGAAGATSYTPGVIPLTNQESSALVTWTANGSGELAFTVSDSSGFSRLNGFELAAVPEPSSAAALLIFTAGTLLARRSHSRKG